MNQQLLSPKSSKTETSKPQTAHDWIKVITRWFYIFSILSPLYVLIALYGLAFRASHWLGHWPQPEIDDPKFIAMNDWVMDFFYELVGPAFTFTIISVALFPFLVYLLWRFGSRKWIILGIVSGVLAWITLIFFIGDLMTWYID